MGDFVKQTALELVEAPHGPRGELGDALDHGNSKRRFRTNLASDWMTWGPAGGYVAAIALRAVGAVTRFERPASFSCQYLSVARFDAVDLTVEVKRAGRRSEALQVSMTQQGSLILTAQVWAVDANSGLEHDYTDPPDVKRHDELRDIRELMPHQPQRGLFQNFERRPTHWVDESNTEVREPVHSSWFRFQPNPVASERFADACRALILIDSFTWPATWPAHPSSDPSPWIAPNLDLHVRFHHDARSDEWLLCQTRADLAADGLIGTEGRVWNPDGRLIAVGSSQLFCRPRPKRFR